MLRGRAMDCPGHQTVPFNQSRRGKIPLQPGVIPTTPQDIGGGRREMWRIWIGVEEGWRLWRLGSWAVNRSLNLSKLPFSSKSKRGFQPQAMAFIETMLRISQKFNPKPTEVHILGFGSNIRGRWLLTCFPGSEKQAHTGHRELIYTHARTG